MLTTIARDLPKSCFIFRVSPSRLDSTSIKLQFTPARLKFSLTRPRQKKTCLSSFIHTLVPFSQSPGAEKLTTLVAGGWRNIIYHTDRYPCYQEDYQRFPCLHDSQVSSKPIRLRQAVAKCQYVSLIIYIEKAILADQRQEPIRSTTPKHHAFQNRTRFQESVLCTNVQRHRVNGKSRPLGAPKFQHCLRHRRAHLLTHRTSRASTTEEIKLASNHTSQQEQKGCSI